MPATGLTTPKHDAQIAALTLTGCPKAEVQRFIDELARGKAMEKVLRG